MRARTFALLGASLAHGLWFDQPRCDTLTAGAKHSAILLPFPTIVKSRPEADTRRAARHPRNGVSRVPEVPPREILAHHRNFARDDDDTKLLVLVAPENFSLRRDARFETHAAPARRLGRHAHDRLSCARGFHDQGRRHSVCPLRPAAAAARASSSGLPSTNARNNR